MPLRLEPPGGAGGRPWSLLTDGGLTMLGEAVQARGGFGFLLLVLLPGLPASGNRGLYWHYISAGTVIRK